MRYFQPTFGLRFVVVKRIEGVQRTCKRVFVEKAVVPVLILVLVLVLVLVQALALALDLDLDLDLALALALAAITVVALVAVDLRGDRDQTRTMI